MIRPGSFVLLAALAVSAATPSAEPPAQPAAPAAPLAETARAPSLVAAASLVPGGLLQNVLVMIFPPQPQSPTPGLRRLDRVALAVEGAESSYGRNPMMWRPDPRGPQGPMQVSEAAAIDVGGGDRFDIDQNRALGRAYLARMFTRYGNWRDALMAYNWGPGNLDQWIGAGRPADALGDGVSNYVLRVLDESGSGDGLPLSATADRIAPPPGPPPRPELREDTIRDPHLRQRVRVNNREIMQLRTFLEVSAPASPDAGAAAYSDKAEDWLKSAKIDPDQLAAADAGAVGTMRVAGDKLVFGIAREVSRRPGYGNFEMPRALKGAPDIASVRVIAGVLLERLEDENATLAMIDAHRREERIGDAPAKAAKPLRARG